MAILNVSNTHATAIEECIYDACCVNYRFHVQSSYLALMVLGISSASIAGNGLVILSFFSNKTLRQQNGSYFVANLAASDLMCTFYVMLPSVFSLLDSTRRLSGIPCHIHTVSSYALFNSSYMSLAAINLDRAIAIKKPFNYPNIVTSFRVKLAIAFIWLHGIFYGTLASTVRPVSFEHFDLLCAEIPRISSTTYTLISTILCFGLSSVMLFISVVTVIWFVYNNRKISPTLPGIPVQLEKNTKTLKSLFILVGVYFIFVPPYYVTKVILAVNKKNIMPKDLCFLPVIMLFAATAINPLIYGILRKDRRKASLETIKMVMETIENIKKRVLEHFRKE